MRRDESELPPGVAPVGSARAEILSRIREALADGPGEVHVTRNYERSLPASVDLVDLFVERVGEYEAQVHRASPATLPTVVEAILTKRGARRVAAPLGLGIDLGGSTEIELLADEPRLRHDELDGIDGVVTGCTVAIAETGTIVLDGSSGQGRRVLSLLPDLHLCVVYESQLVGTVPEALSRLDPTRPQTWISGPSATSDIELQRVKGVHGPRRLDVVVIIEGER